ncbi:MAG: hypothetical protein ABI024_00740 [Vicinamibacterales bacterium]
MTTMEWLTLASVLGASALFIALAVFLKLILEQLEPAGGLPTSFLAKIRLGLRAIEIETGNIPSEVPRLTEGLSQIAGGLSAVDRNLAQLGAALQRQEGR